MIQSYLKTGMVFHESQDDQHWRNECCQEIFYQYFPVAILINNNNYNNRH